MTDDERALFDDYLGQVVQEYDYEGELAVWMFRGIEGPFRDEEPEFKVYVRRCILRLLEAGAVASHGGSDGPTFYTDVAFVGLGPEETADGILAELAEFDDPDWCGVWFVRPRLVGR
jgi:hypothetical protein